MPERAGIFGKKFLPLIFGNMGQIWSLTFTGYIV